MMICAFCQKKLILKYMMSIYDITAVEIAKAVHLSDTMVRKHIDGDKNLECVDIYIINRVFGLSVEGYNYVNK